MRVLYKPTNKIHNIDSKTLESWRNAGFNVQVLESEEKPKAIKEREKPEKAEE